MRLHTRAVIVAGAALALFAAPPLSAADKGDMPALLNAAGFQVPTVPG